ncbi:MAG: nitroreductase family protein [Halioglobus sp.]
MLNLSADELLSTTRSVRKRLDFEKPVARPLIEECLELALQAPNGSNLNTWRWILVDDSQVIAKMANIYCGGIDDFVATLGENVGENYAGSDIPGFAAIDQSVDHLRQNMHRSPAMLLPLMAGRMERGNAFSRGSAYGSIVQATWSFFLALRERGLGSAWTTAHLWREKEMAELLNVPFDEYTQIGLFPIAYTIGTDFSPAYRKPVSEVAFWNTFSKG